MACLVLVFGKDVLHKRLCVLHYACAKVVVLKDFVPLLVDKFALLVQNVVKVKEVLTDFKVAGFYLLLCLFYRTVKHAVVDWLTVLHTDGLHDALHLLSAEEPHQVVVHGDVEFAASRVTLAS